MARTTNGPAQTRRAPHRRPRPATRLRTALDDNVPQQRRSPTPTQELPARPQLRWVLVTDDTGRTHPEARWNA